MGLFSRMKDGIKARANAAIDKAIDPEKEIEMAIAELEEQRQAALKELVAYKVTAKTMEEDLKKHQDKAETWEKRAIIALKAGDEDAARQALREKKNCAVEAEKIQRDRDEAAGHAIALNKSRKQFETKLQLLKLRKGTLATQLAAARSAGGDAFGNDPEVWEKFRRAEEKIDEEVIHSEVDAALRGEALADRELDAKIASAAGKAGLGAGNASGAGLLGPGDDALAELKAKMASDKAAKQKQLDKGKGDG